MSWEYSMSYDRFDQLCDDVNTLKFTKDKWIPTTEQFLLIKHISIKHTIGLLVWIVENNVPETKSEKDMIKRINRFISEKIRFVEEAEECEKREILYSEYEEIVEILDEIGLTIESSSVFKRDSMKVLFENKDVGIGLVYLIYKSAGEKEKVLIKEKFKDEYLLKDDTKDNIVLSLEDYNVVMQKISRIGEPCENWIPTVADIDKYIIPNFKNCYDYALWVLKYMTAESEQEKESLQKLRKLVNNRIILEDREKDHVAWFLGGSEC